MNLTQVFLEVARRVDGEALVRDAVGSAPGAVPAGPIHVLSLGKVAFPMFAGLIAAVGPERVAGGLVIAPQTSFPASPCLATGVAAIVSDHPEPSERSVAAGRAAIDLLARMLPSDALVVLLSGGASSAMALPSDGLSLDDKRSTTRSVARAGARITELNAVRKHLSAIKGGQLALRTRAGIVVLALSDVVGNDPGAIGSGPFSPDPTTFAEAAAIVARFAPDAPGRARAHLRLGAAGALADTPKPGDPRLGRVRFRIVAGPERIADEARHVVEGRGLGAGILARDTESAVDDLAIAYGHIARTEAASPGPPRVLIGNGEPSIVVQGQGRGGRATHLALAMAREITGLRGVSFLAAGTDDRDGAADASGAVVDHTTWARAERIGLDPAGALARFDSEVPLKALGCLVRGPGTSNLLDLHLLGVGESRRPSRHSPIS
jgi:glycerate 2-kinase